MSSALHVKMKNPKTGEIQVLTPQNALDMEQHNGWKRIGHVKVKAPYVSDPQEVLDNPRGVAGRRNAANASLDEAPDVEEEEVESLDDVDTTAEDPEPEEEAEGEEEVEDDDPDADGDDYSTRSAIAAGR